MEAEIKGIKDETHDVKTFRLEPEEEIDFVPGQFCLVSIKEEGFPDDSKPFTFSSSPEKDFVEMTVKKVGEFTTALHSLEEGDKLELTEPRGKSLNFDESVDRDIVFIAGGSGITPFISAIRYSIDRDLDHNMTLFFSNREYRDIIYRTELRHIYEDYQRIKVVNTLTHEEPDHWDGETGLIDREMIEKHVDDLRDKIWYICGPPPMIDAMEELLEDMGVEETDIRFEKWQIPGKHD